MGGEGGSFVFIYLYFIPLFQFNFLSLDIFFHFVACLLQTGMILGIYCSQVGADRYFEKHLTAYLGSLHKKVKNVPLSRHKMQPSLSDFAFLSFVLLLLFQFSFSCPSFLLMVLFPTSMFLRNSPTHFCPHCCIPLLYFS